MTSLAIKSQIGPQTGLYVLRPRPKPGAAAELARKAQERFEDRQARQALRQAALVLGSLVFVIIIGALLKGR